MFLLLLSPALQAQKTTWRQATDAELASLLPARAPVEKEHIETEMRTASGIVNNRGRFIAGVVLLTAGYSADGKYSHYLVVQTPIRIGGIALKPANMPSAGRGRRAAMRSACTFMWRLQERLWGQRMRIALRVRAAWRACTSGRRG